MNLVELLNNEIEELQLNDELAIVYHLYRRTGEIFDYDPKYEFVSHEDKKIIAEKEIDIYDVKDYEIICTTWAKLFINLLKTFNIEAKIHNTLLNSHPNVLIKLKDGRELIADLMIFTQDVSNIKMGLKIQWLLFNKNNGKNDFSEIAKRTGYITSFEEELKEMKQNLENLRLKESEKTKECFRLVASIINNKNKFASFYSSRSQNVFDLLLYFLDERKLTTKFYDLEKKEYFDVYSLEDNNGYSYYALSNEQNGYQFNQIPEEQVYDYLNNYNVLYDCNINHLIHTKKI